MKLLVLVLLPAVAQCLQPGGVFDATLPANSEPLAFALQAINQHVDAAQPGRQNNLYLVQVVRARYQVVAGLKYYLSLHLSEDYYCNITVWYRPYLTGDARLQVTDGPICQHQAQQVRTGGISRPMALPQGLDQPENVAVLNALNFAACAYNDGANSAFAYVLGDTSAVTYTQQVTAGTTYRFYKVDLKPTDCENKGCAHMDLSDCAVSAHGGQLPVTCNFVVQDQPWMKPQYTLTDEQC